MKKPKKSELPSGGDCYNVAGRYLMDHAFGEDSGLLLVHGEVGGQGPLAGIRMGHAWIEDGDMVIDNSNGTNRTIPKQLYYAIGNIGQTFKYTMDEMRKKVLEYGHWGPWDLKTEY